LQAGYASGDSNAGKGNSGLLHGAWRRAVRM
jgi:hypothetical protein